MPMTKRVHSVLDASGKQVWCTIAIVPGGGTKAANARNEKVGTFSLLRSTCASTWDGCFGFCSMRVVIPTSDHQLILDD
jgi:hypothetical protein